LPENNASWQPLFGAESALSKKPGRVDTSFSTRVRRRKSGGSAVIN